MYYIIFKYAIIKFNILTPGRGNSEFNLISKAEFKSKNQRKEILDSDNSQQEEKIVEALGGANNIIAVTCCATRLRVSVKDKDLVELDPEFWKTNLNALGLVIQGNSIQAIYGTAVNIIEVKVKQLLEIEEK